jgi:hypothetical protein
LPGKNKNQTIKPEDFPVFAREGALKRGWLRRENFPVLRVYRQMPFWPKFSYFGKFFNPAEAGSSKSAFVLSSGRGEKFMLPACRQERTFGDRPFKCRKNLRPNGVWW